ncbi:MAG: DegT/DnrJ/EryC1/StrS family aminotransferase [Planctomycetota bacterium]
MYRHGQEEIDAVTRVLRSGQWFRYGDSAAGHQGEAARLETAWCKTLGADHACFTNSGTAALMCCYAGLGIGPGDEVIIPAYTWIASATAVLALGAIPILCDIDASLMLDPNAVEQAITSRTKAICPVHMNGLAADLDRLREITSRHKIFLLEDACQAIGGIWRDGRHLGTLADAGAYSFNHAKVISCGEGGMFVTPHAETYERALIYHDAGVCFRVHASSISLPLFAGINLRGNEILAALVNVQLDRLNGIVDDLHRNRRAVSDALATAADSPEALPTNGGPETGTGATLGFRFADEAGARAFATAFRASTHRHGAVAIVPIDSGRHVFTNWEAVLQHRGAATEAANPYHHPANAGSQPDYSPRTMPNLQTHLTRSVLLGINPDWTAEQCLEVAAAVLAAARSATTATIATSAVATAPPSHLAGVGRP